MKRAWRVLWWSTQFNEARSKSYAYEAPARKLMQRLRDDGAVNVDLWFVGVGGWHIRDRDPARP